MPVQNTDSIQVAAVGLAFTVNSQVWSIATDVTVSSQTNNAVSSTFSSSQLINRGMVVSDGLNGVNMTGSFGTVFNEADGTIFGAGQGVRLEGLTGRVVNHGDITGGTAGVYLGGAGSELTNTGTIYGYNNAVWIDTDTGGATVENYGTLTGFNDVGINVTVATTARIGNYGVISAGEAVLAWSASAVRLTNSGTIDGGLGLAGGEDRIVNSGQILDAVFTASGDDLVRNPGQIFGLVFLGAGDDVYDGRSGSNEGFNVNAGDGDDLLRGGGTEDDLRGDLDVDRIYGNGGDDLITGGRHADTLAGGLGGDTFLYLAYTDSTPDPSKRDTIVDFSHAQGDRIDLSALDAVAGPGNQAFNFIGTAAFTGTAGQLRYATGGGGATVLADADGDAVADFAIFLDGVGSLVGGDFAL